MVKIGRDKYKDRSGKARLNICLHIAEIAFLVCQNVEYELIPVATACKISFGYSY